eukprot:5936817-Pyramimonas_sp.AAC.1
MRIPGGKSCSTCRGSRDGGQCKRVSARATDLAGSCSPRGALTLVSVKDPAGSRRILQDPPRPD